MAHVYCGQTAGLIKMLLGTKVGLSSGNSVLDGDPAPSPQGVEPAIFGPWLLWPNGWMDQDATWHEGRPRLKQLCVRWGPSPPPHKGAEPPPQCLSHFYSGQTAGCIKMPLGTEVGLTPGDFVLDGDPVPLPKKGVEPPPQIFGPCLLWLDGSRCYLARR